MRLAIFSFILIVSFIGIAVFGFLGMQHHGIGHEDRGCIATVFRGADCADGMTVFDFASFHLDIFKSFSTATVNESATGFSLLLITLVFLIGSAVTFDRGAVFYPVSSLSYARSPAILFFPLRRILTRWLALHENSPASLRTRI